MCANQAVKVESTPPSRQPSRSNDAWKSLRRRVSRSYLVRRGVPRPGAVLTTQRIKHHAGPRRRHHRLVPPGCRRGSDRPLAIGQPTVACAGMPAARTPKPSPEASVGRCAGRHAGGGSRARRAALGRRRAGRRAVRLPGPDGSQPPHRLRGRPRRRAGEEARRDARTRCRASGTSCSSCSRAATSTSRSTASRSPTRSCACALLSRPYYVAAERLTVRRGDAAGAARARGAQGRRSRHAARLAGRAHPAARRRRGAHLRRRAGRHLRRPAARPHRRACCSTSRSRSTTARSSPTLEVVRRRLRRGAATPSPCRQGDDAHEDARIDAALDALAARRHAARASTSAGACGTPRPRRCSATPTPTPRGVAEAWEAWRAAVGKPPPFCERRARRYPRDAAAVRDAARRSRSRCRVLRDGARRRRSASLLAVARCVRARCRCAGSRPRTSSSSAARRCSCSSRWSTSACPSWASSSTRSPPGVLALGLNYAAAEGENYRAGLESVPPRAARGRARARACPRRRRCATWCGRRRCAWRSRR